MKNTNNDSDRNIVNLENNNNTSDTASNNIDKHCFWVMKRDNICLSST